MSELDAKLYSSMKSGDKQALEELYDRYVKLLYSFSYKMLEDKQQAEEIVQEVFIKIWTQKSHYDESKGKFSSWLLTTTRNTVIDTIRKRKEIPSDMQERDTIADTDPSVEDQVEWKEKKEVIQAAMNKLGPDQRQVIELFYFKGMSQQKISDQCDIPLGTVKGRIRLALKHLREQMQTSERNGGVAHE
ncbi:RNA polymerase sigma-70 factor [Bacillus sp. JCM 19046]|uniref:RNA polymerase sigma-70 factor (ECF subfamily) n=1 Tax=Shouchella xiaoxiensis TaxID=766895 RepID=A0ABS2SP30_9BACI|nr:sigma-70 family RNA polymerase sigma factor [Shouchella xiaoxiensis]MBM7837277.1 RNA polymerase sigma-70 factor (ECF subfamily) [Shouchella xiaoxiensis]GAF11466.1 RNA polymerase sigma-70 factor [Bacillus sp. JCM 19045]GAF16929.1 RNA polymerase sigma-70 factor [Bacillus sp. JCM 19046]